MPISPSLRLPLLSQTHTFKGSHRCLKLPRTHVLATIVIALLGCMLNIGVAVAADPIMPSSRVKTLLSQLPKGESLKCYGLTVFKGTEPERFDVEVYEDSENGLLANGPRLWGRPLNKQVVVVQGASGSPIYCPDSDGIYKIIGGLESGPAVPKAPMFNITPIERMLAINPDAPSEFAAPAPALSSKRNRHRSQPKPSEKISYQYQDTNNPQIKPGSMIALTTVLGFKEANNGAGTVTYVDGNKIWFMAHGLTNTGARLGIILPAEVIDVVPHTNQMPTKFVQPVDQAIGTFTQDTPNGMTGVIGLIPPTLPVTIEAEDSDTGARDVANLRLTEEHRLKNMGGPADLTTSVGKIARDLKALVLGSIPRSATLELSAEVQLHGAHKPFYFRARHTQGTSKATDFGQETADFKLWDELEQFFGAFDKFEGPTLNIKSVKVKLRMQRGTSVAHIRSLATSGRKKILPVQAKTGETLAVNLGYQPRGDAQLTHRLSIKIPKGLAPGQYNLTVSGEDEPTFAPADRPTPIFTLHELRKEARKAATFPGLTATFVSSESIDAQPVAKRVFYSNSSRTAATNLQLLGRATIPIEIVSPEKAEATSPPADVPSTNQSPVATSRWEQLKTFLGHRAHKDVSNGERLIESLSPW